MERISVEELNMAPFADADVINAWKWFMSFISDGEWKKRKVTIEKKITMEFGEAQPAPERLRLVVKEDLIGWYLYLLDGLINEPHKYENFQGARIVPIFKSFGMDLDKLKAIEGLHKRIKQLLRKRQTEADAFLFEFLTALLWARNGYQVAFLDEKMNKKTPDMIAKKDGQTWNIECKRQSKTSDYTYRETAKRQKMLSYISRTLIARNIILDITFHVELESLPDTFLLHLLEKKLQLARPGKIVSNDQVEIELTFVDIPAIKAHLEKYHVKYNSPMMNSLIGRKPVDNKSFTCGLAAQLFRVGEGNVNNVFISDISNAFGVYWNCDAKEAVGAKARDIKNQVHAAMQQFNSEDTAVIHVGMETFDGPEVEKARFEKIRDTIKRIDPAKTNLRWIFCHFFQAYSPPDQLWVFDETVSSISPYPASATPPLSIRSMIVPEDADTADGIYHWDRPLP